VVGEKAKVGELPAKDVVDHEDGCMLVRASDVGLVVGELALGSNRFAVPFEGRLTAIVEFSHFEYCNESKLITWRKKSRLVKTERGYQRTYDEFLHGFSMYLASHILQLKSRSKSVLRPSLDGLTRKRNRRLEV